jgi:hypothetical protein
LNEGTKVTEEWPDGDGRMEGRWRKGWQDGDERVEGR